MIINMRGIELEDTFYQDIEWTADVEVHLLFAMVGIKPVGVHRSFHMLPIWDKFTSSINKNVSPRAIWKHLETMYDLATLDEAEGLQFPNDFKEFSLPGDEFEELMEAKRKGTGSSIEAEVNTDESSSDFLLSSEVDKESKKSNEKIETPKTPGTKESTDETPRKSRMSLSLKKRKRDEDEKIKADGLTNDDAVSNSESVKKKKQKRESETSVDAKEGLPENQRILSEDEDVAEDTEKKIQEEPVKEFAKTPSSKDRKYVRNKKKRNEVEGKDNDNQDSSIRESEIKQEHDSSQAMFDTRDDAPLLERVVEETEEKKKKSTNARSKDSKLRRKASMEKSEEGTDIETGEEEVKGSNVRKTDVSKVESTGGVAVESDSKKRTRKHEEESEKKNVKETESSLSSKEKRSSKGRDDSKSAMSHRKNKVKDEVQEDKLDSEDEVYLKRKSVSSPMKFSEEQSDDSDGKRLTHDKKKNKRERSQNEEVLSSKNLRRGSLKTPVSYVAGVKSECSESRRLSRGDDASKASSSDDTEPAKSDTEKYSSKKDSKSDSRKAERTYSRSKGKTSDVTSSIAEPETSQAGSTPGTKKDRQRDSLAKGSTDDSSSNKRRSLPASSKRVARSVNSTPEPTSKRRRVV